MELEVPQLVGEHGHHLGGLKASRRVSKSTILLARNRPVK
jgi:hypothetical protein